jgi:hypothetical protein
VIKEEAAVIAEAAAGQDTIGKRVVFRAYV